METARVDFDALAERLNDAASSTLGLVRSIEQISHTLQAARSGASVGEQWAQTWGEVVTRKQAAVMLGVSTWSIANLINEGNLKVAPDGRVVVRSAAEWANRTPEEKRKARRRSNEVDISPWRV